MRTRLLRPVVIGSAAVLAAGVATAATLTSRPVDGPDLAGLSFVSTHVDGHELVDGTYVVLAFQDDHLAATAGCNHLLGPATWDDGTLVTQSLATSMMACPPDLAAQDDWLGALLTERPTLTLTGTTLEVRSGGTTLVLEGADV
ncbi:META domain-containing protein [Cellulomonas fimi]|uniref:DUF306 domain-containing protein n=1 Tax=Cellulomonas fimi (strain ATCC 484 / DSM 20113 / JCM 1341 / CCUG 24087 / LMG 16345 / NBRC 15513 / NCIMB 8980 / NCTC 7547 / NRS-133) TaxID=590998 RepID=F4H0V9_CELFA|nr:META domain-containing protein [Cellulomonas fimi]AEE46206.1 protein of unknown function DUF306 Meta and HslJ [Cellulomonas fimi ATCC 484]NNH08575.1 META domain-containing protein [Cellulomonas fimi]VEH32053.1 heat-inducible protein [Cellulomonas fimi]